MRIKDYKASKKYCRGGRFAIRLARLVPVFGLLLVAAVAGRAATLWQNTDTTTIVANNSISCNLAGSHANNSYWRVFTPLAFGYHGAFAVSGVRIGIEEATAGSGANQPFTVRIYANTGGSFPGGTRTLIGTTNTTASNGALFFQDISVTVPSQPAGIEIVVEIFTPDGQAVNNRFFIGSNNAGQSAPSYISAADCSAPNPVNVASAGAPNMHTLIALVGSGPTAANVSLAGRVMTADGRGITNATVSITMPTGEVRTVLTSAFGFYTFDQLEVGYTYVLSISAKRYRFSDPIRVISLTDEVTGQDFVASDP